MDASSPASASAVDGAHLAVPSGSESHLHTTTVTVNNRPVDVTAPKATGLQIKEAAKAAGLPIELDFVLSHDLSNGDDVIVGDGDVVTVNPMSRFTAIAPDDNS